MPSAYGNAVRDQQLRCFGQRIVYTDASAVVTNLTAIIGPDRYETRNTNYGTIQVHTRIIQICSDANNSEFGGVTNPEERATCTIDSELWEVETVRKEIYFGGMHQLHLVALGANERVRQDMFRER